MNGFNQLIACENRSCDLRHLATLKVRRSQTMRRLCENARITHDIDLNTWQPAIKHFCTHKKPKPNLRIYVSKNLTQLIKKDVEFEKGDEISFKSVGKRCGVNKSNGGMGQSDTRSTNLINCLSIRTHTRGSERARKIQEGETRALSLLLIFTRSARETAWK